MTAVVASAVSVLLTALAGVLVARWQSNRKRAKVSLYVENRSERRYVSSLYGSNSPLPRHDYLILRVAIPNDGHGIELTDCKFLLLGDEQSEINLSTGANKHLPCRLEPSDWYEEYATVDSLRRSVSELGALGQTKVMAIVRDSVGNTYSSLELTLFES